MTVLLNKEAAAERLILAAVQMCERGDDPLAIHVVAMSALSVLRELLSKRGPSFGTQSLRALIYIAATKKLRGEDIPRSIDEEFNSVIDEAADVVAGDIAAGKIGSPDEVELHMPRHVEQAFYRVVTAPFNYLKHADRDGASFLSEQEVDPVLATTTAITALNMLFPGRALPPSLESFFAANTPELRRFKDWDESSPGGA